MQIKLPYLRSIAAGDPPEADVPNHNQSDQPSLRATRPSHTEHCQRPSANEHMRNLLRGCDKIPYGEKSSTYRDLVYAPPRGAIQRFIEDAGCPAHILRITPEGTRYFEGWFRSVTLAGRYSDVERFLHAIPPRLRKAIEKVYCFLDGESPSDALRFYSGRWRQYWSTMDPDAWRGAEKRRRRTTMALMELLGDRVQVVQVFTYKCGFVAALEGITGSDIDVPEWPEDPAEASGSQAAQGRHTEQEVGDRNAGQSSQRARRAVHRMQWEATVEWAATVERGIVHRQVFAGQRRKQHIPYDPEGAFQYDQEPYQAW